MRSRFARIHKSGRTKLTSTLPFLKSLLPLSDPLDRSSNASHTVLRSLPLPSPAFSTSMYVVIVVLLPLSTFPPTSPSSTARSKADVYSDPSRDGGPQPRYEEALDRLAELVSRFHPIRSTQANASSFPTAPSSASSSRISFVPPFPSSPASSGTHLFRILSRRTRFDFLPPQQLDRRARQRPSLPPPPRYMTLIPLHVLLILTTSSSTGLMCLYDNRGFFKSKDNRTKRVWLGVAFVTVLLAAATFLLITGTWGSMCVQLFVSRFRTTADCFPSLQRRHHHLVRQRSQQAFWLRR